MEETPTEPADDPMREGMEGLIAAMRARKPVPPAGELGNASTLLASASGEDDALAEAPWHAVGLPSESELEPRAQARVLERGAVVGRYVVLRRLGAGGMGVVYAAYDPELDRKLALKLLLPGVGGAGGRARLLREAQALAKLAHPHVVAIHDVGTIGEQVWLAMEFVQGRTLSAWLGEPRRWPEVVQTLREAGEGLVAAHAAGLLHRDFKPDNVMVGDDGRVRVMDFGLARVDEHAERRGPDESRVMPVLDTLALQMTQEGTILGTPSYMPPEQFGSAELTAAADQFAFCVTLWEALYGERPFAGSSWMELVTNVLGGRLRSPPKRRGVPSWLRRACERGLSADPQQRWPSMSALLETLARGRLRAGARKGVAVLGGLALLGAGVVAEREYGVAQRTAACEASGDEVETAWSPVREQALREGLVATGVSYAATTADHAIPWLEQQATAWREARVDACLETDVHGRWSTDTLDRSLWCLDERRAELESLVDELTRADAEVLQKAVTAAAALSSVEPCRDPQALGVLPPPPTEEREAIGAVRASVTRAGNLERAGRYEAGLELASGALGQAEALAWRPLTAMAGLQQGSLLMKTADYPAAEKALEAAYSAAIEGGAPEVAVDAASELVRVVGYFGVRYAEGRLWGRLAEVALADLEGDQRLRRANLLGQLGILDQETGAYDQARGRFEEALAIKEHTVGPGHPIVASALTNLASLCEETGAYGQAEGLLQRAIAIKEQTLGSDHPEVSATLAVLALVRLATGDHDHAQALLERVLSIQERTLGVSHPSVADTLNNLAAVHHAAGAHAQAKASYARAISIQERTLPDHPGLAENLYNLALLHSMAGEHDQARPLYERALAIYIHEFGPDHPEVADCLEALAGAHAATGSPDQAQRLYEQALAIQEAAQSPDHLRVALSLYNLAVLHQSTGNYDQAQPLLERALAIYTRVLGPDHTDVADCLDTLAGIHVVKGAYEQAQPLYERALVIREAALGSDPVDVAYTLEGLAEVALAQERPAEALPLIERATGIMEDAGVMAGDLVQARFLLARVLWSAHKDGGRDRARAVALAEHVREALRDAGPSGAEDLAEVEGWLRVRGR